MYELLASNHYPTLIIHQISYSFVQLLADFPCTFDNACGLRFCAHQLEHGGARSHNTGKLGKCPRV